MSDDDLIGDPMDYNPSRSDGTTSTEGVPIPDRGDKSGSGIERKLLDSADPEVSWDDSDLWFDCPFCGDRLKAVWYYSKNTKCDECGAKIFVQIKAVK